MQQGYLTSLSDTFLMIIFGVVSVGVLIMSLVLWYHWVRYSMGDHKIGFAKLVYVVGLIFLFLLTLILLV